MLIVNIMYHHQVEGVNGLDGLNIFIYLIHKPKYYFTNDDHNKFTEYNG